MRSLKQIIGILATGYILMFYSELMFWARVRPDDSLPNWLSTWLAYSLLAYVFLSILARFQVDTIWGLFLAGAAFGWLAEGLVVQTAYEDLPLSISFTGLAWHALISVWVGWGAVRKALSAGPGATARLAALIGCGYGLWAISWWLEPDGGMAAPLDFAAFALVGSLLLVLAYWLAERCLPEGLTSSRKAESAAGLPLVLASLLARRRLPGGLTPSRKVEIVVALLFILYFIFVTVPAAPLAAVILPALLLVLYLALRRGRSQMGENREIERLPTPPIRYLGLLALPLAASLVYAAAFALGLRWHSNWVVYLVTTPAGFIVLAVSLVKAWRRQAPAPEV